MENFHQPEVRVAPWDRGEETKKNDKKPQKKRNKKWAIEGKKGGKEREVKGNKGKYVENFHKSQRGSVRQTADGASVGGEG